MSVAAGVGLLLAAGADALPLSDQVVINPSNPSWLFRPSGAPIFICGPGDPEGFLFRGTENPDGTRSGDQDAIINRLTGTGANSLYVMVVRSHGGDGDATHNPFVDHDPSRGLNSAVLDQWDGWLTQLDDAGIVVHLFIYDDSARIWDTGNTVGAAEEAFVRAIVDRFEGRRNLVWCVAEEYAEALTVPRASSLAAIIRDADDHDHPVAIHQNSGLGFDFENDPSVDQFAMQYNVGTADQLHAGVSSAFAAAAGRYQITLAEAMGWGTGAEARQKSWACAMGGAYVMILGMDVAGTPISDLEDCGRLVSFFESTTFHVMEPADALAQGDTKWVLAEPAESWILYAASGDGPLGLAGMPAGVWDAHWFDCATGATAEQLGVSTSAGDRSWARPAGIGAEAALWIARSGATSIEPISWGKLKGAFR